MKYKTNPAKKLTSQKTSFSILKLKMVVLFFAVSIFFNFKLCAQDNTPPTFTVPADYTMFQGANCSLFDPPDTTISGNVTDAADPCGILSILYRDCEGRRPGGAYGRGEGCSDPCTGGRYIERTWEVEDNCGNKASGIQIIYILDTIKPVFTTFPPNLSKGSCDNVVYDVVAEDNCLGYVGLTYTLSGATTETGSGSGSGVYFNEGVTTVTITATDECGNTRQQSFTVTLTDTEPPVIDAPNLFKSFSEDNYGCSYNLGASATDNCQLISLTSNAPSCFPVGTTTVTWTATDQSNNVSTYDQRVTRAPEDLGITISAGITSSIYRGTYQGSGPLGPQSLNLTSAIKGGLPPYTYSWSPATGLSDPNIANPVANPASTTTYTLTVTDFLNSSCSLSITINVLQLSNAICTGNGNSAKFNVCHIPPGSPSNPQNICISQNALSAHLLGGNQGHSNCYLGPCTPNTVSTAPGFCGNQNPRGVNPGSGNNRTVVEDFKVLVAPNPSSTEFLIQVFSKSNEKLNVRIFDNNGVLRSVSTPASGNNYVIVGNNFAAGLYMAEIIQGNNRKVVKLVKLN